MDNSPAVAELERDQKSKQLRESIRQRLVERREKILGKIDIKVPVPKEMSQIRELCVVFYHRRDPWFRDIQQEVDKFIGEVQLKLKNLGYTDARVPDLARDMIINGVTVLSSRKPSELPFVHYLAYRTETTHGAPYLMAHLDSLVLLDGLLEHLSKQEEDTPLYDLLFQHASKLQSLIRKDMSQPLGGFALSARIRMTAQYASVFNIGWRRLAEYEGTQAPSDRPRRRRPKKNTAKANNESQQKNTPQESQV